MAKIYKVIVSTDICVLANDSNEAVVIARQHAAREIEAFNNAEASVVNHTSELSSSWAGTTPYHSSALSGERRTCKQIVVSYQSTQPQPIKKKEAKKEIVIEKSVPVSQNIQPALPRLRFKI